MNLIGKILKNEISIQTFYKDLILLLVKNEIKNLLLYVKFKYPDILNNDNIINLFNKYKNIKISNYSQTKLTKLYKKINKKVLKRRIKNCKSLKTIINKNKTILNYKKNDKYCNARIWNGGQIINIDNKTIYGCRCSRYKMKDKDYCHQHSIKNKHGSYFDEPTQEIKNLFIKFNQKENNKG